MTTMSLFAILIAAAVVLVVGIALAAGFVFLLLPMLKRARVKSSGEMADAIILDVQHTKMAVYSNEAQSNLTSQELVLKLEVHRATGEVYQAENRGMYGSMDLMRLQPGYRVSVRINPANPGTVAVLPETAVPTQAASTSARVNVAMANAVEQLKHAKTPEESNQIMASMMQAQGIHERAAEPTAAAAPSGAVRLAQLKDMLDKQLISAQEYEAKKAEILAKM